MTRAGTDVARTTLKPSEGARNRGACLRGRPVVSKSIGCWVAESEVADLLRRAEKAHEGVAIGSYPFFREGRVGANFVVRSPDEALVDRCLADLTRELEAGGRAVTQNGI